MKGVRNNPGAFLFAAIDTMSYELSLLLIVTTALALGYRAGRFFAFSGPVPAHRSTRRLYLVMAVGVAWFLLAVAARHYAETDAPGWAAADWFAHRGKWFSFLAGILFLQGAVLYERRFHGRGMTTFVALLLSLAALALSVWQTMPIYRTLPPGHRRDAHGFLRQSVFVTCGPVSLGNLLEQAYGIPSPTERKLARLAGTTRNGTTIRGLQRAARRLGIVFEPARVLSHEAMRNLKAPAIISISTLPAVRHAIVILDGDDEAARVIDPEYGYGQIDWDWIQRIQYGKTLELSLE